MPWKAVLDLGFNDDREQIEIETTVYRRVIRRKRYRQTCDCSGRPRTITAPLPPKLLPKSIYGTSLWTHLLLEKYHLQRPMQRTIEQLRRLGRSLAAGTIADGLKRIEPLLTPIYDAIRTHHVQSKYFHADETRWRVFVDRAGTMGHRWWLGLFAGEDSVVFVLDPSRRHDVPQSHFPEDLQGVLMVDRYSGLTLFVDDPRVPIDNNYGERLIRNPAVGRKNYYGSGSEWSGRLAMMLFSLLPRLLSGRSTHERG